MMTTTSEFRKLAQQAERDLDWGQAAYYWACAIEAYPGKVGKDGLAKLDIAKMTERRDSCRVALEIHLAELQAAGACKSPMDDVNYVGHPIHY